MGFTLVSRLSPWSRKSLTLYKLTCLKCHRVTSVPHIQLIRLNHSNPWVDSGAASSVKTPLGSNELEISTGRLARFADGCAVVKYGETSVMVTAVSKSKGTNASFLPLTVDYRQKAAAAGRIPTNYLRRELGPTDREILTSRVIDRSIRPLFPCGYNLDTQVLCNLLAVDGENDPDILSINAASAALAVSDIPWNGPIGAVRVGYIDNEPIINPTRHQLQESQLNLILAGTEKKKIVMIDASADNLIVQDFKKSISFGLEKSQKIIASIKSLQSACGKEKREMHASPTLPEDVKESIHILSSTRIKDVFTDSSHHKFSRDNAISEIRDSITSQIIENYPDLDRAMIIEEFYALAKKIFRELILTTNKRCDGRSLEQLRDISCEVNKFAPLHGSSLFQRGQTQVLATLTFDSPDSAAKVDAISAIMSGIKEKNFFLHYEFPPYSTNETGRPGAVGRREIGHGALAEKALRPVIPDNFPFTIRLTTEVLESNGSSSLASACAGSLALLDAGVPISSPVGGVAVGLITKVNDETREIEDHRLLTDLLGIEDYMGDMDFKLAGSLNRISALQADLKLPVGIKLVEDALDAGLKGNKHILNIMGSVISVPREPKENRPVTERLDVPPEKRGKFLGSGGFNLKRLAAETGVTITPVEEGLFQIFAPNEAAFTEAKEKIDSLLTEQKEPVLEFGAIYKATITEIREYGVMVKLYPNMTPTLIHNSQLDQRKVNHPSVLNMAVGQEISVKYFGLDPASGKVRLSRKVLYSPATSAIKNLGNKYKIGD